MTKLQKCQERLTLYHIYQNGGHWDENKKYEKTSLLHTVKLWCSFLGGNIRPLSDGLLHVGGLHDNVKNYLLKKSSEFLHWSFFFYTHILIFVYCVYFNLSIIFCQALIKFQLESSTEVTKRQISKVVMAIGSGEEGLIWFSVYINAKKWCSSYIIIL